MSYNSYNEYNYKIVYRINKLIFMFIYNRNYSPHDSYIVYNQLGLLISIIDFVSIVIYKKLEQKQEYCGFYTFSFPQVHVLTIYLSCYDIKNVTSQKWIFFC